MNKANILPLFSTPVYVNSIDTDNAVNYVRSLQYTPSGFIDRKGVLNYNCFLANNYYILNDPVLSLLKRNIEAEINSFLKEQLCFSKEINFNITTSWAVKHRTNHFSQPHFHANSLYSGVVYLQVDDNSGGIYFESKARHSPLHPAEMFIDIEKYNIHNSVVWEYLPKNNDIIIFPSHLIHSVSANKSKIDRYVISFNIYPSGILGKNTINELVI